MQKVLLQPVKGFRDFLPSQKRGRDFVAKKVVETFELFGFEPIETPTLEYSSLLLGKYGKEADKLIYTFKDKGERELALRYDQTVPTARFLAQYQQELPKYFRRYQVQNVFRADKPQKGRFREFTQCDIDIFGTNSPIADAEILATTYFAFKNVGYPKIKILVNDRWTLFQNLIPFETERVNVLSIIQTIDKLEKIGEETTIKELVKKGLSEEKATNALIRIKKAPLSSDLATILALTYDLGVSESDIEFKKTLARGLDYYTGMIFEVTLPGYGIDSCAGGGRYDKLIEQLGGVNVPAVGIAFGFDRMVEAAEYFNLISKNVRQTEVLVTIFDITTRKKSLETANFLRQKKISTEVFPADDRLDKQLKYADKKDIPYVIIIGPDELKKGVVKLKNMSSGNQKELKINEVINSLTR